MWKSIPKQKGQLEIMGLVIIVILISLGMLFLIQFALKSPAGTKKTYTREQLASNTVNSIIITTTECQGLDFSELIKDFAAGYPQIYCNGENSKDFTKRVIEEEILDKTLKEWGKNYEFTITTAGAPWINITNGRCPGTKDSSTYFIRSNAGMVLVRLDVCD